MNFLRSLRRSGSQTSPIEALEPRSLLSAPTATVSGMWTDATSLSVVVDWGNTNQSSLGNGDLTASVAGHATLVGTMVGTPALVNGKLRVRYDFQAYDNAWGVTDNGAYTFNSPIGQVTSLQDNVLANPLITTRNLTWATPKARLVSNTMGQFDWLIVVQYNALNAINLSTIDATDLSVVTGRNNGVTLVSTIVLASNNVKAIYSIKAENGAWSYYANGTFRLAIAAGAVEDASGRSPAAHNYKDFGLWFGTPRAKVLGTTIGDNDWLINVQFSAISNSAIAPQSLIETGTIIVTGPGLFREDAVLSQLHHNTDLSYTATFRVNAKGGAWDFRDNGHYNVTIQANQVKDASNRFIPGYIMKTFSLWFTKPTAEITDPGTFNASAWDVSVRFLDDVNLNRSWINSTSIRVVGPNGLELDHALISLTPGSNSNLLIGTFRTLAPFGGFVAGGYKVYLNAGGLRDVAGNVAGETLLGTFNLV